MADLYIVLVFCKEHELCNRETKNPLKNKVRCRIFNYVPNLTN